MLRQLLSILTLIFLLTIRLQAQTVDSTFGTDGYLIYGATGNDQENDGAGNSTVIQPDGKIITAISKNNGNVHNDLDYWTYRYNADGTPDATFGTTGASGIFAGDQSQNMDIQVQSDGKIVVIGQTEYCILGVCGAPQFIMMRLQPDGTKDSTFGTDGQLITTDIFDTAGLFALGQKVILAKNGKYIIAGKGSGGRPFVARLNHDGTNDVTFGINGIYSDTSYYSFMKDIVVDANENIYGVLLNYGVFDTLNLSDVSVFKLDNTGQLDVSFGNSGHQLINVSNRDVPTSIALRSDGQIVVAGFTRPTYSYGYGELEFGFAILLNSNGTLSSTFPQGYQQIEIPADSATFINKVVVTENDKMVFAGYSMIKNVTGNYELKGFIYCLDSYGNLFTPFNSTGMMSFDYGMHSTIGCYSAFNDIDILSNGDIYATGYRNPIAHNVAQSVFIIKLKNSNLTLNSGEVNSTNKFKTSLISNTSSHPQLKFELPSSANLSIRLTSIDGTLVKTIVEKQFYQAGVYSQEINYPVDLAAGIYYVTLRCSNRMTGVEKVVYPGN